MALSFPHVIRSNEYGFYCVPESYFDRDIVQLILEGNVYEPMTLRFLRRQIGQGSIVTGGAFIGDFLPALHDALSDEARIICFEPVPMNFEALSETVRLNGLDRVEAHNVAVSDEDGDMTMMITRPSGKPIAAGERIVEDREADGERYISIPTRQIDALVPETADVSILHLDVEGHEEMALRGAAALLKRCMPLVVLEAGKAWRRRTFEQALQELAPDAEYTFCGEIEYNAIFRAKQAT